MYPDEFPIYEKQLQLVQVRRKIEYLVYALGETRSQFSLNDLNEVLLVSAGAAVHNYSVKVHKILKKAPAMESFSL